MSNLNYERLSRQGFHLDTCSITKAQRYVRRITGLRVRETEEGGVLPEKVSF